MIQTDDKRNQQEHALAQLLVHAPRSPISDHGANKNYGENASDEELAMLAEGKLDDSRREQILNQLNDNPSLYETWMMLQEFTQCDSFASASEHSSEPEKAQPAQPAHYSQNTPTFIEKITDWFSELFSWQGAFATSFGVALGAVFMMQAGLEDGSGYESDLKHGIAVHAPMEAPQKANVDKVELINQTSIRIDSNEISRIDILKVEGLLVHFKVTLKNGEELVDSYELKLDQTDSGNK